MGVLEGAALIQWVNASCVAQGLPLLVNDAGVVAKVCTLLQGGTPGPERRRSRRGVAVARSDSPPGIDTGVVEGAGASGTGCDDGVVNDSPDDRGLNV